MADAVTSPTLAVDHVAHGFFTRQGGVSDGLFTSLNCGLGSGDAPEAVAENRRRVAAQLSVETLVTCHQVHSADAVVIDASDGLAPWQPGHGPRADAVATKTPGIALGVLTADCAPVLLLEPEAKVIAVAHAGWRGALSGVTDAAIAAMERLGAARPAIRAAVGPCITQPSYEVGPEFPRPFLEQSAETQDFFAEGDRDGHWQFDLAGYVVRRLRSSGISEVAAPEHDTYADEARFFSYRRSCHRDEPDYGRCISAIALPE
jgi:YfiH family protein